MIYRFGKDFILSNSDRFTMPMSSYLQDWSSPSSSCD